MKSERGEDAWLATALEAFRSAGPVERMGLGIGDDAASVRVPDGEVVIATDVLIDGVHFELADCGPAAAARKALAVNISDLAACGATPLAFVVGGVLPRPPDRGLFDDLMVGFEAAAREFDCVCAGGDTNSAEGPLVLAVTVLGRPGPMGVVSRAGARVGDVLSVTGPLGGSRAGRHLTFVPRMAASRALVEAGVPRAMMDLSDGLGRDLPRLCRASAIGARLDPTAVPIHDEANSLAQAVGDGEDFELLVAHAPLSQSALNTLAAAGVVLTPIGRAVAREHGIVWADADGDRPFEAAGFDHLDAGTEASHRLEVIVPDTAAMLGFGTSLAHAVRSEIAAGFVLDLRGELGMGKTVLVRGLARALGVPSSTRVTSPTFVVAREYTIRDETSAEALLQHVDAYRIGHAGEMEGSGFEEMCGEGMLTCVEWAGRVESALPEDRLEITLTIDDETAHVTDDVSTVPELPRRLRVRARGPRSARVLARLRRTVGDA